MNHSETLTREPLALPANVVDLISKVPTAIDRVVALRELAAEQALYLRSYTQGIEAAEEAIKDAVVAHARAWLRRGTFLIACRESMRRVAGESVITEWESAVALAYGLRSPKTIRRWMLDATSPAAWWEAIENHARMTGKPAPISKMLEGFRSTAREQRAETEGEDEGEEDGVRDVMGIVGLETEDGEGEDSDDAESRGMRPRVEQPPGGHYMRELLPSDEEAVAADEARLLELLHAKTFKEAVANVESYFRKQAALDLVFESVLSPQDIDLQSPGSDSTHGSIAALP